MPIPATGVIRLGQPELLRVRDDLEPRRGLTDARHGEEQIIRPQTVPLGMRGELGNDMRAELHTAVLLCLRVVPDQKLSPSGWNFGLSSTWTRLTLKILVLGFRSRGRSSTSSPHRRPVSMAVSTSSWAPASGSA